MESEGRVDSGRPIPGRRSPGVGPQLIPVPLSGLDPSAASNSTALRGLVAPRVPVTPWGQNTRLRDQGEIRFPTSV